MSGFEVGILGGPGDGELMCVPSAPGAMGPPHFMPIAELHRDKGGQFHHLVVQYALCVNEANSGPLWFYVRDPKAPDAPFTPDDEDGPITVAAGRVLRGHHALGS